MDVTSQIRGARFDDLPSITEIYNEAIMSTTATFDTVPKSLADREAWFASRGPRHPILVAEIDGATVGWAALSPYSDRAAYDDTGETACYVHKEFRGRGIGRQLKCALLQEARRLGYHSLLARVTATSQESLRLNTSLGFQMVGTLREVGRKFGQLLDVHILQIMLDDEARTED